MITDSARLDALEAELLRLAAERGPASTACPSEAARALAAAIPTSGDR
jgi:hypothetical protein